MKKVHRVIKVDQKAWLKPYINMNTDLRVAAKMILKKTFSSWWIQFLEKLCEIFKIIRILNYLVSEPNYPLTKFLTENVLAMELRKTQILMNKLVHLR